MPFIFGSPPDVPVQLEQPRLLTSWSTNQLAGYGFMAGVIAAVFLVVVTGSNASLKTVIKSAGLPLVFSVMLLTIVAHEMLHALMYKVLAPRAPVWFGLDKKSGMAYCYCPAPLSRERFVAVILAPFLLMSVLPFALTGMGLITPSLMLVMGGMNAVGAGADLMLAVFALKLSRKDVIQSSGMAEYCGSLRGPAV